MAKVTKRMKAIQEKVDKTKLYPIDEAISLLQDLPKVKFVESIDASFNLGIDTRKSDQAVRGSAVLPHGTGKTKRVAVMTQGDKAEAAKAAGADIVGFDDLADSIKKGDINFDILIATPDAMRVVGPLGQILGPRGLMPNPKDGTVTAEVATAVENAKKGQVKFRADKGGIVHCVLGKIDFSAANIKDNLQIILNEIKKLKPASAKGVYIKKVTLSTTMGAGIAIDLASIS